MSRCSDLYPDCSPNVGVHLMKMGKVHLFLQHLEPALKHLQQVNLTTVKRMYTESVYQTVLFKCWWIGTIFTFGIEIVYFLYLKISFMFFGTFSFKSSSFFLDMAILNKFYI